MTTTLPPNPSDLYYAAERGFSDGAKAKEPSSSYDDTPEAKHAYDFGYQHGLSMRTEWLKKISKKYKYKPNILRMEF